MNQPPLLLERYFFTKISVLANPDFAPDTTGRKPPTMIDIKTQSQVGEDPRRWMIGLGIDTVPDAIQQGAPYQVSLQVVGFFLVTADVPEDKVRAIAEVNGGSILYSAAREYLLSVTGRGPWAPVSLPTTSFIASSSKPEPVPDTMPPPAQSPGHRPKHTTSKK